MTISQQVVKNIILRVIRSQDYRIEIVNIINVEFLQFAIDFFKKVVDAKLRSEDITIEWYRNAFMNDKLPSDDIAINAGLNKKTISNMYGSATKSIVIDAANEHFDSLFGSIQSLVEIEKEIDFALNIKFKGVSVELNVSESLIVINTLAVKRAALRGGLWSTAGKSVEKYLMLTLCKLFGVDEQYYDAQTFVKDKTKGVDREIDFYLLNGQRRFLCEIKLMGKGNPESADAIIARDSQLFVADTLSQQNKNQCDNLGVKWVALRDDEGYLRFADALTAFGIPYMEYKGDLERDVQLILDSIIQENDKTN